MEPRTPLTRGYNKEIQFVSKRVFEFVANFVGIGAISIMPGFAKRLGGGTIDHLGFMKGLVMQILGLLIHSSLPLVSKRYSNLFEKSGGRIRRIPE